MATVGVKDILTSINDLKKENSEIKDQNLKTLAILNELSQKFDALTAQVAAKKASSSKTNVVSTVEAVDTARTPTGINQFCAVWVRETYKDKDAEFIEKYFTTDAAKEFAKKTREDFDKADADTQKNGFIAFLYGKIKLPGTMNSIYKTLEEEHAKLIGKPIKGKK